jgi:two-component system, NarL family, nitrate/nitrite response regulator NarL
MTDCGDCAPRDEGLRCFQRSGILDGLANKEIARNLNISETSVMAVVQELFRKAGVRTRSQLVRIAIEKHSSDWLEPST